ncbi:uncharacterized protein LOC116178210 isoform X1 [Photinus pyralis]|nr:uncharacterized protein LOC116178210 isoform X1 [Photinus pyralis]
MYALVRFDDQIHHICTTHTLRRKGNCLQSKWTDGRYYPAKVVTYNNNHHLLSSIMSNISHNQHQPFVDLCPLSGCQVSSNVQQPTNTVETVGNLYEDGINPLICQSPNWFLLDYPVEAAVSSQHISGSVTVDIDDVATNTDVISQEVEEFHVITDSTVSLDVESKATDTDVSLREEIPIFHSHNRLSRDCPTEATVSSKQISGNVNVDIDDVPIDTDILLQEDSTHCQSPNLLMLDYPVEADFSGQQIGGNVNVDFDNVATDTDVTLQEVEEFHVIADSSFTLDVENMAIDTDIFLHENEELTETVEYDSNQMCEKAEEMIVCFYCGILCAETNLEEHVRSEHDASFFTAANEPKSVTKEYQGKKNFCPYCKVLQAQLPRHLYRKHADDLWSNKS